MSQLARFIAPATADLHLRINGDCGLNGLGTPIAGITTDYDGETRSTTAPDMGGDEFTPDVAGTNAPIFNSPSGTTCATATVRSGTPCLPLNDAAWHDIADTLGNLLISINPNGSSLGTVGVTVYENNDYSKTDLTGFAFNYMGKVWNVTATGSITTGNEPSIRLYYNASNLSALKAATGCNACTAADIVVAQSSGITEDCDASNNSGQTLNLYWHKDPNNYAGEKGHISKSVSGITPNYYGSNVTTGNIGYTTVGTAAFDGAYIQIDRLPSFSEFRLTAAPNGAPLPVTLVSFTGNRAGNDNMLHWTTASEQGSKGFDVERSADGRSFTKIAFVESKAQNGAGSTMLSYTYNDAGASAARQYYRLRSIGTGGGETVSNVVVLGGGVGDVAVLRVVPNPVSGANAALLVQSAAGRDAELSICDLAGRMVLRTVLHLSGGMETLPLPLGTLAAGSYLLRIEGATQPIRFVRQ